MTSERSMRKHGDFLFFAGIFEDKIVFGQIRDRIAMTILRHDIELDQPGGDA